MNPLLAHRTRLLLRALSASLQALEHEPQSRHILAACVTGTQALIATETTQHGDLVYDAMRLVRRALCLFQTGELVDLPGFFNRVFVVLDEIAEFVVLPHHGAALLIATVGFEQWLSEIFELSQLTLNEHDSAAGPFLTSHNGDTAGPEAAVASTALHDRQQFAVCLSCANECSDTKNLQERVASLGTVFLLEDQPIPQATSSYLSFLFVGVAFARDFEEALPGWTVDAYRSLRKR